jgi:ribosomal protein S18 acetylase RimI-like enzyme
MEEYRESKELKTLRLGVIAENEKGKRFWKRHGFMKYTEKPLKGKTIECLEKALIYRIIHL